MTVPKQYRGRLTNRQIAEGMTAAATNARRLTSDAILLLEAKCGFQCIAATYYDLIAARLPI